MSKAIDDVVAERERQISSEGWSVEHDDQHQGGDMARAAAVYALTGSSDGRIVGDAETPSITQRLWPWDWQWFKPKGRRNDLVRAAALLVAEIERLDRAADKASRHAAKCGFFTSIEREHADT